jgi:integrase/recombinase XerD
MGAIQHVRTPGAVTAAGISHKTATHYVRAIKAFTRWLVRDKRTASDALAHLAGFNEATDRRRVRRDLNGDELARLVAAAESSPTVMVPRAQRDGETHARRVVMVRMTCPEGAWAYRIAAGTGFRASEVASLTPESFDLDADSPTVTGAACYSKRKRQDVQPIRHDLAEQLRPWIATKAPRAPLCPLPDRKAALLIRADLETARAKWIEEAHTADERAEQERSDFLRHTDAAGRVVDFHGLRHTYISRVVESGASVKVAQELARHSTPTLTIGRYAYARLHDLAAALDSMPSNVPSSAAPSGSPPTTPPHLGPQSGRETGRQGAAGCDARTGRVNGRTDRKPLRIAGLDDGVRRGAIVCGNAEGRTRTADLRVMNPAL